jgi:hypothetical protein
VRTDVPPRMCALMQGAPRRTTPMKKILGGDAAGAGSHAGSRSEVPGARGGESSGALPTRLCRWVKSVPRAIEHPGPLEARVLRRQVSPLADRAKSAVDSRHGRAP